MEVTGAPVIEIGNLQKSYDEHVVLKGVNLDVYPGQVIGYIGPNGAGKSTTVKILVGLDPDFSGDVKVNGINVADDPLAVKRIIGYVPELTELYDVLSPVEYLRLIGRLHKMEDSLIDQRADLLLKYFGLAERKDDRMDTFSKGMRQKVLLISGLIHDPKIIFLDEPLAGLDANSVIMVKDIIARLAAEGKTIFYCSHMMDVVEKVSDRIVLINDGQIVAQGTLEELRQSSGDSLEAIFSQLTGFTETNTNTDDFLEAFQNKDNA